MSALRIELKKGFTNEGVVHELSRFPVCKPGAYYVRSTPERELTYDKNLISDANVYFSPFVMRFLTIQRRINHLGKDKRSVTLRLNVINYR